VSSITQDIKINCAKVDGIKVYTYRSSKGDPNQLIKVELLDAKTLTLVGEGAIGEDRVINGGFTLVPINPIIVTPGVGVILKISIHAQSPVLVALSDRKDYGGILKVGGVETNQDMLFKHECDR
jgi:hypothetical protein